MVRPLETGWLPDTPVGDTLLRQFLHSQGAVNALVAEALGGRAGSAGGVLLADSGGPVAYYNQAILTAPVTGADDGVLDDIDEFFGSGRGARPVTLLSIWPTADLSGRGWSLMGHPAFVARGPGPHHVAGPPAGPGAGIEIRRATTVADLEVAERIAVDGYPIEVPGAPAGSIFPPGLLGTGLFVRLGLLDGEPVAIGLSLVGSGVVNLCLGATLPAARRRGVWEALVWARTDDAPELPAVAYTSDFSRPGFIRMGFLPITRFTLWWRGPG